MDQLRADLRRRGITELPKAWQFLHIDVNPVPEQTVGLGDVRRLGGRYVAVGSAGKNFDSARSTVESKLGNAGSLNSLVGWAPNPRSQANVVPVSTGAGQFRGIGRVLTLTNLSQIRSAVDGAWEALQTVDAWGDLPLKMTDEGPYDNAGSVVPIVISSMAGGAGASMFLDVSRILGQVRGIASNQLGLFLFTPDVFASLDPSKRLGIDGNAIGALGEVLAAQMRSSAAHDQALFGALGINIDNGKDQAFGRVFPIGSYIGGSGARFGETNEDIYRGLGRAIAGTMISDKASAQYLQSKVENPISTADGQAYLGWGADADSVAWGSFGYSSLSLGRDRYAHYASQRLARQCVDQLTTGYRDSSSNVPPTEQLESLVSSQWPVITERLGLATGRSAQTWLSSGPLKAAEMKRVGQEVVEPASSAIDRNSSDNQTGAQWLAGIRAQLVSHEPRAKEQVKAAAYLWAENFALDMEKRIVDEVLRIASHPRQGLPFARRVVEDLSGEIDRLSELLAGAPAPGPVLELRDYELGKVDAGPQVRDEVKKKLAESAGKAYFLHCAHWARKILASIVTDVLPALVTAINHSFDELAAAINTNETDAGLAQLHSTKYWEWPTNSNVVPPRFNQAYNEVILTTAVEFPERFREHVENSASDATYDSGLDTITQEINQGRWDNAGARQADFNVISQDVSWRANDLKINSLTGEPTPPSRPRYRLAFSTAEILERATEYQARKDQGFERFSSETFEGYLNAQGISDAERATRRKELINKFEEAVAQAKPLVGVDGPSVQALHELELQTEFTFSAVPLAPGSQAAKEIASMLKSLPHLEKQSIERFEQALTPEDPTSRISIYGAYPKYYPLVFGSFLKQLKDRWTGESESGKRKLWQWKRTRPIPSALAMSPTEQTTMMKAWYLGRALGLIEQPEPGDLTGSVSVYDLSSREWRPFASRLLTSPEQFKKDDGFDWLPAVLEGHTLALVNAANDHTFASLRPYKALREIFDNGLEPAQGSTTSGERMLAEWFKSGSWPSTNSSPIRALADVANDPHSRAEGLRKWIEGVRDYIERVYLVRSNSPGNLRAYKLRVDNVDCIETAPLFAEIAVEAHAALNDLLMSVDKALREATREAEDNEVPQI